MVGQSIVQLLGCTKTVVALVTDEHATLFVFDAKFF
jgi:hypothetical protein